MIDPTGLAALEARVASALRTGDAADLDVIGYGEISTVLATDGLAGPVAAKRLPEMSPDDLAGYRLVLDDYLSVLAARGVTVAPTELHAVGAEPAVPYCVQPRYPRLLVDELRTGDAAVHEARTRRLVELVTAAVGDGVGLDAQVSNWAVTDHDLVYLDVTTPLLRDDTDAERLDTGLFLASLPWALRWPVQRFLLDGILAHYHDARAVLLDVVANLYKERLDVVVPTLVAAVNEVVEPAVTVDEARRYYRSDARTWEALQHLRRVDRWWQRRIRRRRYPFLLPGRVER